MLTHEKITWSHTSLCSILPLKSREGKSFFSPSPPELRNVPNCLVECRYLALPPPSRYLQMTFSGHASNTEVWRYRCHKAYRQADRCGRPRSWCLSCEMQGKQSQKFLPPSSLSKIHLDYEGHIYFLPQGRTGLAHTCQI